MRCVVLLHLKYWSHRIQGDVVKQQFLASNLELRFHFYCSIKHTAQFCNVSSGTATTYSVALGLGQNLAK
ncbi:unnamed protein product [Cylicocyclus nassatus]|uniref:Uncharacterized protein n=1 Tax=Cylicocyclus nassatus TaxID=53992 RepID=A0AA36HFL9_CYLNA|nr:unnamed protein product [Cylicocyclus nassatus]